MTLEPRRWLEDGTELTPDERRALEDGLSAPSPVGAKGAVLRALAMKLAAPATVAAATKTAASAGSTFASLALVKVAGVGLALGTVAGAGVFFVGRAADTRPVPAVISTVVVGATAVAAPFQAAASAPFGVVAEPAGGETTPAPDVTSSRRAQSAPRASEPAREAAPVTQSESERVATARSLLHAGNASRALQLLRALEADEPNGLLAQEREALLIESLASLGQRAAARQRAAAFAARYPTSPHAAAVRRAAP